MKLRLDLQTGRFGDAVERGAIRRIADELDHVARAGLFDGCGFFVVGHVDRRRGQLLSHREQRLLAGRELVPRPIERKDLVVRLALLLEPTLRLSEGVPRAILAGDDPAHLGLEELREVALLVGEANARY